MLGVGLTNNKMKKKSRLVRHAVVLLTLLGFSAYTVMLMGGVIDKQSAGAAMKMFEMKNEESRATPLLELAASSSAAAAAADGNDKHHRDYYDDSPFASSPGTTVEKAPNTIVTAFFETRSKHSTEEFVAWMPTMLSLRDAMVIFTSPDRVAQMKQFRSHALNRTVIVSMNLSNLPLAVHYNTTFWQNQLDMDPEKRLHKSYQLFWIWLSKPWFVKEAIRHNKFQSDVFLWSDIGTFMDKLQNDLDNPYYRSELIRHREVIPRHSILFMKHHETPVPKTIWWTKKRRNFYHSGTLMVGYHDTFVQFYNEYMFTIHGFVERNLFLGEDQAVSQSTCLRQPMLCSYISYTQVDDRRPYAALRYVLHNGGNYTLWRPPLPLIPQQQ